MSSRVYVEFLRLSWTFYTFTVSKHRACLTSALGELYIALSDRKNPSTKSAAVKYATFIIESWTVEIGQFLKQNPLNYEEILSSLLPIVLHDPVGPARLCMIEAKSLDDIIGDIQRGMIACRDATEREQPPITSSFWMDVERVSERLIPCRQAIFSDSTSGSILQSESLEDDKKLYLHQARAIEHLVDPDVKALILHTATGSGKSLVYQVYYGIFDNI